MSVFGHVAGYDLENHADAGGSVDRRTRRTRRALFEALIEMILEGDYDAISVSNIADRANVGRSTFYAHFSDKDDLLRNGVGHFRTTLFAQHGEEVAGETVPARRALGFSRFMFQHLKEQRRLYRAPMRGRAGPIVLERFRLFLSELVRSELGAGEKERGKDVPTEVTVQFVVGAFTALLTSWLDRGAKEAPETMDSMFRALALKGLEGPDPRNLNAR
jgi:AcrR family transcriptional regulator